jgi:hypothetical protein
MEIDRELERLAAAPLGDVREALEACKRIVADRNINDSVAGMLAAIDALAPAGGALPECITTDLELPIQPLNISGPVVREMLERKEADDAAPAPQTAGGKGIQSSDGGCMADFSPNDPANLAELLANPSGATPAPTDDEPLSDRDHAMIDQAWENHKAALPVATVINDNQPGRTAIIEITIDPPTLPVGTKLYAGPKMVDAPPAPADDAAVAWQYDEVKFGDGWARHLTFHKPQGNKWQRKIEPLYTHPAVEAVWHVGAPPKPWADEWFIARTTFNDRVVLTALPEEYTYDFKTADDTYIKADKIKCWMQFPDSQFIAPAAKAVDVEAALRVLEQECMSLKCEDSPTGGDDADVVWYVVSHHMSKPHERTVAFGKTPQEALAALLRDSNASSDKGTAPTPRSHQ